MEKERERKREREREREKKSDLMKKKLISLNTQLKDFIYDFFLSKTYLYF